jgi:hypothetical protein
VEVDLDETLAPITKGFSQKEVVDLVEGFSLVIGGSKVHGRDTHVYNLLEALSGLLFTLQDWYFRMDETCANLYLWFIKLFLVVCINGIIFARNS